MPGSHRRTASSSKPVQPLLTVSRSVRFSAAHRLFNPAWSTEENTRVYGRCSNEGGHGHNYSLTVSVAGPIDPANGMVVNVTLLRDVLQRMVVDQLDHRNLNTDVPFLAGIVPTMENIVAKLAALLSPELERLGVALRRIDLAESESNSVTLDCV